MNRAVDIGRVMVLAISALALLIKREQAWSATDFLAISTTWHGARAGKTCNRSPINGNGTIAEALSREFNSCD
jgi:hypothetical protein